MSTTRRWRAVSNSMSKGEGEEEAQEWEMATK
jgi:hypothetical protein